MTISTLDAATQARTVTERKTPYWEREGSRFQVGQVVGLKVQRQISDYRYMVSLEGRQQLVDSSVKLDVGGVVRATVVAVGDKLELKYVDSKVTPYTADTMPAETLQASQEDDSALTPLQLRHAVSLTEDQRRIVERAMSHSDDPQTMAASGVYLSKLSLPIDDAGLEAVYAAQVWSGQASAASEAVASNAGLIAGNGNRGNEQLAALIKDVLEPAQDSASAGLASVGTDQANASAVAAPQLSASNSNTTDSDEQHDLARRLLNVQDDGSLLYRYGTLPILISGQLVELDLVYFREREAQGRTDGVRRLVMSFKTESLGRVEIVAHALGDNLSIGIKAESTQSSAALAQHAQEVRDLVARMGWGVGAVSYDFDANTGRAASHIVNHVLSADTLNRLV